MGPAESLTRLTTPENGQVEELRRRLIYMMAFRVLLISLVMGATTLLYWLSDVDLTSANSVFLYAIIATTYALTLLYVFVLPRLSHYDRLAQIQLIGDLLIATVIVHITGGAQSAYTFFFPLAIIGSAAVRGKRGALLVTAVAVGLFTSIAYLGWQQFLPVPHGQRLLPSDLTTIEFGRALALNVAAMAGVGALAVQLASQLQITSAALDVQRSAAADLLSLHEDIVRCLTSGLITVDSDGRISTMNDAAAEILGYQAHSAVGAKLGELSAGLATVLDSVPIERPSRRGEITHTIGQGELILGVSVSPLYDHTGAAVGRILNFQDLTEMRKLEQQVRRTERLSVIGGLAAGVAHEIRNPLASISGSIELLGATPGTDEDNKALMNIITREIDRLNGLITELLDYSSPRPTRPVELDLCEVVRDTLRVFAQDDRFESVDVSFVGDSPDRKVVITADPEKVRQLLWNLLRNGAQAAQAGGRHLEVSVTPNDDSVTLQFKDDGPGIPEEVLHKVFDPFFTTKAKGSGLGLATVHSIVAEHGGKILVESEANKGACFRVELPYTRAHDAS